MKKIMMVFSLTAVFLLSACGIVGEVNDTLDYVNNVNDYLAKLGDFAEESPQLIQEAATNPEVREELTNQLNGLVEEIEAFNKIEPPAIAEEIHQEIVSKNERLLVEIENVTANGEVVIEEFENSGLLTTISELTELLNTLEQLVG